MIEDILVEVWEERERQTAKHGDQSHLPDLDPVLTNRPGGATASRFAEDLEVPTATRARFRVEVDSSRGTSNFAAITLEEFCEAVEAAANEDRPALRTELVQVAAMAVQWIEALDAREVTA